MRRTALAARLLAVLVGGAVTGAASAATAVGFGPRVGLTGDPDQLHMGLTVCSADVAPQLRFVPSVDVGIGNDLVLLSGNFDFKYVFPTQSEWRPYMGGGPALHFIRYDNYDWEDTEVGAGVFGGMQTATRSGAFFTELRLGLIDSPDLKFTVGWLFQ